jgi:hypothetical protein
MVAGLPLGAGAAVADAPIDEHEPRRGVPPVWHPGRGCAAGRRAAGQAAEDAAVTGVCGLRDSRARHAGCVCWAGVYLAQSACPESPQGSSEERQAGRVFQRPDKKETSSNEVSRVRMKCREEEEGVSSHVRSANTDTLLCLLGTRPRAEQALRERAQPGGWQGLACMLQGPSVFSLPAVRGDPGEPWSIERTPAAASCAAREGGTAGCRAVLSSPPPEALR